MAEPAPFLTSLLGDLLAVFAGQEANTDCPAAAATGIQTALNCSARRPCPQYTQGEHMALNHHSSALKKKKQQQQKINKKYVCEYS